jgi:hypothetical protein
MAAASAADRLKAYQKRWRTEHPNYGKQWRKRNKKRVRELKQRWRSDPVNVAREKQWALARQRRR